MRVLRQQEVISQLVEEIDRLKVIVGSNSQTSSKPPSSDIHKRSEKSKEAAEPEATEPTKRKPGGQPVHAGKTRVEALDELTATKSCDRPSVQHAAIARLVQHQ